MPQTQPPKPLVTAELTEIEGDPGINVQLTPNSRPQQNGSFATDLDIKFTSQVGTGIYRYVITMTCHHESATVPLTIYVNECPTGAASDVLEIEPVDAQPAGQTDQCGFTPTPTPFFTPALRELDLVWGNLDCSPGENPIGALLTFLNSLFPKSSPTPSAGNCPQLGEKVSISDAGTTQWGDWNCDALVDEKDGLAWLKWIALLQQLGLAPCPPVGVGLKVGSYYVLPD